MKTSAEDSTIQQDGNYFRGWLLPVLRSPALREEYREYRHRGLVFFIRVGGSMLLLLIYLLSATSSWLFYPSLEPHDASLWISTSLLVIVTATLPVLLCQFERFRRHYDLIATPFSAIIITKFAVMPMLYSHPGAATVESYFCMLAILIITLALRLNLLAVLATLLISLVASGILLLWLVPLADIHWQRISFYFFAMAAVCLVVAVLQDVYQSTNFRLSKLVEQQADTLQRLVQEDSLTGLANRRGFDNTLQHEWLTHRRQKRSLGVLFIDVDHFKAYNDHYGHEAGDRCLQQIGQAIRSSLLRASDTAARYGGEEFVVLLADIDRAGAHEVAQRLLQAVDRLALAHAGLGEGRQVSVSIGVAVTIPAPEDSFRQLLKQADDALYSAKRQGRHQVVLASADGSS